MNPPEDVERVAQAWARSYQISVLEELRAEHEARSASDAVRRASRRERRKEYQRRYRQRLKEQGK